MSKDFHGGRTYAADSREGSPGFGFGIALKFAWLKAQLANLFGLGDAAAADGSQEAAPNRPLATPANDAERDAELRLVSMFQVFDGPGNAATRFGSTSRRRQAETQDR